MTGYTEYLYVTSIYGAPTMCHLCVHTLPVLSYLIVISITIFLFRDEETEVQRATCQMSHSSVGRGRGRGAGFLDSKTQALSHQTPCFWLNTVKRLLLSPPYYELLAGRNYVHFVSIVFSSSPANAVTPHVC